MDIQLILVVILALLTINLLIVGVYVVLVLKDFRVTLTKTNDVLDNVNEVAEAAGVMTQALSTPVSSISSLANTMATSFSAVKSIRSLIGSGHEGLED